MSCVSTSSSVDFRAALKLVWQCCCNPEAFLGPWWLCGPSRACVCLSSLHWAEIFCAHFGYSSPDDHTIGRSEHTDPTATVTIFSPASPSTRHADCWLRKVKAIAEQGLACCSCHCQCAHAVPCTPASLPPVPTCRAELPAACPAARCQGDDGGYVSCDDLPDGVGGLAVGPVAVEAPAEAAAVKVLVHMPFGHVYHC
jgi:hypothetical protein